MANLTIRDVHNHYGDTQALRGISLEVRSGELFSLLGPSGCGKTTLLRIVAGFVNPSRGSVLVDGEDITNIPPHRRNMGMVFQDYAIFPDRNVFENVAFGLKARKLKKAEIENKVRDILDRMDLAPYALRSPSELSGGQRQRVAMARALVISPRILLLDEPLSALDAKLRVELRDTIREMQRDFNITTLFVTHDQEEALSISDRVALLNKGRMEQLDDPRMMYDYPASAFVADFLGGANLLTLDALHLSDDGLTVRVLGREVHLNRDSLGAPRDADPSTLCLCVRPEGWAIADFDRAGDGAFVGEIVKRQFQGAHVLYHVMLEGKTSVRVLEGRQHGHVPLQTGSNITLNLPSAARIIPTDTAP